MRRRLAGLIGGEAAKRVPQLQIIGTVMTEDVDAGQDQFLLIPLVSSSTWCLMFWCRYKSQSEQSLIQKIVRRTRFRRALRIAERHLR